MLTYALIAFAIGALGGLTLAAVYVLRGRLAPWPLSLLHAALGAIGLLLVIYAALTTGIPGAASNQPPGPSADQPADPPPLAADAPAADPAAPAQEGTP